MAFNFDYGKPKNKPKKNKKNKKNRLGLKIAAGAISGAIAFGSSGILIDTAIVNQATKLENKRLQDSVGELRQANQLLDLLVDSYKGDISDLEARLKEATTPEERDALLDQIEDLKASLAKIQADGNSDKATIDAREQRIVELEAKLAQQKPSDTKEIEKLNEEIEKLNIQITVLDTKNKHYEDKTAQIERENAELTAQAEAEKQKFKDLLDKYNLSDEERQKYYDELKALYYEKQSNKYNQEKYDKLLKIYTDLLESIGEKEVNPGNAAVVNDGNVTAGGGTGGNNDGTTVAYPAGDGVSDNGTTKKDQSGGIPGVVGPGQTIPSDNNNNADRTNDGVATATGDGVSVGDNGEIQKSDGQLAYESAINQTYANETEFKNALKDIMTTHPYMTGTLKEIYGNQYADLFPATDRDGGR